jgi:hypothetical protein
MRKLLLPVALVLAGGLVFGPTLAGAQNDRGETLVVVSKTVQVKHVDLEPSGETPGDIFLFRYAFFDEPPNEPPVGTAWVKCTLHFGTVAVCTAAVRIFDRGAITGTGAIPDLRAQRFTFPVTGGTGDFQNVSGEVHARAIDERTIVFTFHLSDVRL